MERAALDHLVGELRRRAATFPRAVVAGSLHMDHPGSEGPRRVNECVVLDGSGRTIWAHHKCGYFHLTAGRARKLGGLEGLDPSVPDPTPVREWIDYGDGIAVLETPLGRLGVAVCADVLETGEGRLASLVLASGLDLLVIVSMTPKTEEFTAFADEAWKQGLAVAFVNARCALEHGDLAAFVHLPFWCDKKTHFPAVYTWDGTPVIGTPKGGSGSTARLLPGERGLVVELGPYWTETFPPSERI